MPCAQMMGELWWVCPLMMIAGLTIVVLAVWSFRGSRFFCRPGGHSDAPPSPEAPLDILKRRYARGEINKQQFEEMRKDILA